MKRLLTLLCLGVCFCLSTIACKRLGGGGSETESNGATKPPHNLRVGALELYLSSSGLQQDQRGLVKNFIFDDGENKESFAQRVEEGKRLLSERLPKAVTAEQRAKLTRDIFALFVDAFLPKIVTVVASAKGKFSDKMIIEEKARKGMNAFLDDVEQITLMILKKGKLTKTEHAAISQEQSQKLAEELGLGSRNTQLNQFYDANHQESAMALTTNEESFDAALKQRVSSNSLIFGLASGILTTLVVFAAVTLSAPAAAAAAASVTAMTAGAVVGIGFVCIIAMVKCVLAGI